ncbi:MAG: GNAT family N-acetyltransferase [Rhizobiales bacterium]|nr:GNAT family N-acetyltransferase [Hyphomicrobiales bacterium]
MNDVVVAPLHLKDAHELAPLVAACVQERKRGAPRAPDQFYAELLLKDRTAEIVGARVGGRLVGYAVFFDLPDTMTGMRTGQLDDLFVLQDARGRKVGEALVTALAAEGRTRGWQRIRWMVPEKPETARLFADRLAESGGWLTYSIGVPRA